MGIVQQGPTPNAGTAIGRGLVSNLAQTLGGLKTFADGIVASSGLGASASDVCNKVGTSVADGSVAAGATLLSIRTGLGATETEYARFSRSASLGPASLNLYQQARSNTPALSLFGAGAGSNGISFESYANNYIGVGSGFVDLFFTNSCFRFNQNNDAFSPSAAATYDFQGQAAKAYPFMRLAAPSGYTGKLISALLNGTEQFSVDNAGNTTCAAGATAASASYNAFYASNAAGGFASAGTARLTGAMADGASAVAGYINTTAAYANATAKLWQWLNNSVEKAYVDKDGSALFAGLTAGSLQSAAGNLTLNAAGGTLNIQCAVSLSSFTDDSATPGNRTVNKVRGKNAIAAGAAAVTITNSFVTANSQILVTLESVDATLTFIKACVPAAGSFTLTCNANATAAAKFSWTVIN